jgi:hypothetical protein
MPSVPTTLGQYVLLGQYKNWSKESHKSAAHWQQGTPMEMLLRIGHLIHFNEKVKVSY